MTDQTPRLTPHVEVLGRLSAAEITRVAHLVEHATEVDGVRPLSEHVALHLRYGGDQDVRNVLLYAGDDLAAYAHLDVTDQVEGASAELVVHPDHRMHGLGSVLVRALIAESPGGRLRLWAHGEHPAAAPMAESLGFRRTRQLWQMRRSLYAPLPPARLPGGVQVRTFLPGLDDDAWVALNARAFADHPEQGAWTVEDLRRRLAEPWFDPAGFFVAVRADADGTERMVGFHWTKVHGGHTHEGHTHPHPSSPPSGRDHDEHGHEPIGEVYVVGVDPAEQGQGLGKALTLVGLAHLRSLGLPEVMLYVDGDNAAAIRVYTALGFTHWDTDVMFRTL